MDGKLKISIFLNKSETRCISSKVSCQLMAKLITQNSWSPSLFRDNYRNNKNFLRAHCLALDIDQGLTLKQAYKIFKEFKHIIAPSRSHQKLKNGVVCDRFRIILFLSKPILSQESFRATWKAVHNLCPWADTSCSNPGRHYYPSQNIYSAKSKGKLIIPQEEKIKKSPIAPTANNDFYLKWTTKGLNPSTLKFLMNGAIKGERNNELFKAALDAAKKGYPQAWAIEQLSKKVVDSDFSEEEAQVCITNAYKFITS